jgi:hypothetical protein
MSTRHAMTRGAHATSAKPEGRAPVVHGASPERVRARAYDIYLARVRTAGTGDALSDWLQAERELAGKSILTEPGASTAVERRTTGRAGRGQAGTM